MKNLMENIYMVNSWNGIDFNRKQSTYATVFTKTNIIAYQMIHGHGSANEKQE